MLPFLDGAMLLGCWVAWYRLLCTATSLVDMLSSHQTGAAQQVLLLSLNGTSRAQIQAQI